MGKKVLKKRGFTLVEIIAVIVILSSIMLIIIPLVVNNSKKGESLVAEHSEKNIIASGKNWGIDNKDKLPTENNKVSVFVDVLLQEGYLSLDNPDENIKNSCVVISNKGGVYYYSHHNYDESVCSENSLFRTVTYDYQTNGGTPTNEKIKVLVGSNINLKRSGSKENYMFVGWNTNKDAKEGLTNYVMPNSNVTLYAIYKQPARIYSLTIDKNDGSPAYLLGKCTIGEAYNKNVQPPTCQLTLPSAPAKANYTFIGWGTSKNATSTVNANTEVNLKGDTTYYAVWKPVLPTCKLSLSGTITNGWYTSDVKVKMTTTGLIDAFGLDTSKNSTNTKMEVNHNTDGKSIVYYGYVKNANGSSSCSATIKRDTTPPYLKVTEIKWASYIKVVKNTCTNITSKTASSCVVQVRVPDGYRWPFNENISQIDATSGIDEDEQKWKHNGDAKKYNNWTPKSKRGSWTYTIDNPGSAQATWLDWSIKLTDKAGHVSNPFTIKIRKV